MLLLAEVGCWSNVVGSLRAQPDKMGRYGR